MSEIFTVYGMNQATVQTTFLERASYDLDPDYQRPGGLWSKQKRQLLIDSLLNNYDIPKIYVHRLSKPDKKGHQYAVVDGKQRLAAIWSFLNNEFELSADFELLRNPSINLAGKTYSEITNEHPIISAKLGATSLPIMVVDTSDLELIEDLFSRLNEAVPLSAAEKRNSAGGPIPKAIRRLCTTHALFTSDLPFPNSRYRHFDLACKFLFLAHHGQAASTKKKDLDDFVEEAKDPEHKINISKLIKTTEDALSLMEQCFTTADKLLKNAGVVVVYFLLFLSASKHGLESKITRAKLAAFEKRRGDNRAVAEKDITKANYKLLRYEELLSTLNDAYAINYRLGVIASDVLPELLKKEPHLAALME